MARAPLGPPPGYRERAIGGTMVVARHEHLDAVVSALGFGTLHAWASIQPGAVALKGRGIAWATKLPSGADVVVRHSRHGGLLAGLTRDLFLAPTRAPRELAISERLRGAGVLTPELIAYAVYSATGPLCRADVVTARVHGVDLPAALMSDASREGRQQVTAAVGSLLHALWETGARHADLNAKNIVIARADGGATACVIDVDRVSFHGARNERAGMHNVERLVRSLDKWRELHGLQIAPSDMTRMSGFGDGVAAIPAHD